MGKGVIEGVQADGEQNVIAINIFHHHHGHHHDHQHHDPDQDQHLQLCTANWQGLVGVAGGWLENWIPPPRKKRAGLPHWIWAPPIWIPTISEGGENNAKWVLVEEEEDGWRGARSRNNAKSQEVNSQPISHLYWAASHNSKTSHNEKTSHNCQPPTIGQPPSHLPVLTSLTQS